MEKKDNKGIKVIRNIMLVLTVLIIISQVFYTRFSTMIFGIFALLIAVLCMFNLYSLKEKNETMSTGFNKLIIIILIIFLFIGFEFGQVSDSIYGIRSPFEYNNSIIELKQENSNRYSFFPDKIPSGAKKVKWAESGINHYTNLKFVTNKEYLDDIVNKYEKKQVGDNGEVLKYPMEYVYHDGAYQSKYDYYGEIVYENDSTLNSMCSHISNATLLPNNESTINENCKIFLLAIDDEDEETYSKGGICVNYDNNSVCFFVEYNE